MKKTILIGLSLWMVLSSLLLSIYADKASDGSLSLPQVVCDTLALDCQSAVLMEATTGQVLYVQNPDEALPPASVTKVMTLLLIMEAIDSGRISLSDSVFASETAASMGGSQVYLKVGECMSVEDLLKSVVISSANDAAVALAEHVAGDLSTFVQSMNDKAAQLGMKSTHFENATGLDDTAQNHLTSAMDIAIMSRALIEHETILKYSSIWMDTIRGGAFELTNTNRLVRFYRGATGLKTGSTSKAGFCVTATAERDGLSLICVIMGAPSRDVRNAQATKLLDWGFANYGCYTDAENAPSSVRVLGGTKAAVQGRQETFSCVLPKGDVSRVQKQIHLDTELEAPLSSGARIGAVRYFLDGKPIGEASIVSVEDVSRIGFFEIWQRLLRKMLPI